MSVEKFSNSNHQYLATERKKKSNNIIPDIKENLSLYE